MKLKLLALFTLQALSSCSQIESFRGIASLETYQGADYEPLSWRCGAPLVNANKNSNVLEHGNFKLKSSLQRISKQNIKNYYKNLGQLSSKETQLIAKIEKMPPNIIHRTSVEVMSYILPKKGQFISATKRGAMAAVTPGIEESLFGGWDCIFASVTPLYGILRYGTVIVRIKPQKSFSWGSLYTGFTWYKEFRGGLKTNATDQERKDFSKTIFTNDDWNEAIALQIISYIRTGDSIRGRGRSYDKHTMLDQLLQEKSFNSFWKKVTNSRLGFLEAHYTDNIELSDIEFIQFREKDRFKVEKMKLPVDWFNKPRGVHGSFIQFFNRTQ